MSEHEHGQISIHTENIFPIIKKWLYSEKEIFLRELVSNAVDAIHKLQNANLMEGLGLADDYVVELSLDKEAGILTVKDNGIGMTADEVRKYITQVAFSSAEDFVEKFKNLENKNEIIGHFGLGFYSSYMVADTVEIRSLSYQKDAQAVQWKCDGTTDYELWEIDKKDRGTEILVHLSEDEKEFLEESRVKDVLKKYCNFLPVTIRMGEETINDSSPLWTKPASEISDEEYKEFYQKLHPFSPEPLFWIHLNIDFPFNLKGILYFPHLTSEFDVAKSHIKLFCNQVFVSDNTPELIPEFLRPLQGCLDAPDLPLNVSRSYLQNEPQVRKINEVITGRVASKLNDLAKKDKEGFRKIWDDIHTFVKFGMMQDDRFYDKVKDQVIYKTTGEEEYTTLPDYLVRCKLDHENKVYYANDEAAQATYLKLFKGQGIEVLVLDAMIDNHFISFLEHKNQDVKFERVDADVTENLIGDDQTKKIVTGEDQKTTEDRLQELFKGAIAVEGLEIRVESLKDESVPGMILLSEQTRRMQEMTRMMGQGADTLFKDHTLLVNSANPVVKKALQLVDEEKQGMVANQVYDLAMLAQQSLTPERMDAFLERSGKMMELIG